MDTQAVSISLHIFKHKAKAMATQAASASLNMFARLTQEHNKILHNNTESLGRNMLRNIKQRQQYWPSRDT
jgi:hypothetical protein